MNATSADWGNVVSIYYKGGVSGETPIDIKIDGDPLTVVLGSNKLPRGIEEAIIGLTAGDETTVTIPPEKGYGHRDEKLAQWYPRLMMNDGYSLTTDDVVFYTNPEDGHRQPAFITKATQDNVLVDFNHPFAGKSLDYWIKVVSVK